MTAHVLAIAASTVAGVLLIPQVVRLRRTGETTGVAVTWAALGAVGNLAWVVFLIASDLWLAAIAPAMAVLSYAAIVRLVAPTAGASWMPVTATYVILLVVVGHVGGLGRLGVTLAIVPLLHVTPQVVAIYREERPTGVSPWTWALSVTAAGMWMVYGMLVSSVTLAGYGLVRGSVSGLVLLGWWMTRRRPAWTTRDVTAGSERLTPAG